MRKFPYWGRRKIFPVWWMLMLLAPTGQKFLIPMVQRGEQTSTHRNIYSDVTVRKTTTVINIKLNHSLKGLFNKNNFAFINTTFTENWRMIYVILGPDSEYFLLSTLLSRWTFCAFGDAEENVDGKLWKWETDLEVNLRFLMKSFQNTWRNWFLWSPHRIIKYHIKLILELGVCHLQGN